MEPKLKCQILFAILSLSPATTSMTAYKEYADAGDLAQLWRYYQNALNAREDKRASVEGSGLVSFEMLRTAMEAVYRLQ